MFRITQSIFNYFSFLLNQTILFKFFLSCLTIIGQLNLGPKPRANLKLLILFIIFWGLSIQIYIYLLTWFRSCNVLFHLKLILRMNIFLLKSLLKFFFLHLLSPYFFILFFNTFFSLLLNSSWFIKHWTISFLYHPFLFQSVDKCDWFFITRLKLRILLWLITFCKKISFILFCLIIYCIYLKRFVFNLLKLKTLV